MSRALDLLRDIILNTWLRGERKNLGPGQIILELPEEKREILKELTSDEVGSIRPDSLLVSPSTKTEKG